MGDSGPGSTRRGDQLGSVSLFAGGGEVGREMAARDWADTPLGPVARWPASLRTTVRIMLTSRFSMWMAWGPELTMFYNDAYQRDTLRTKHPWALGRPAREVWAEIWHEIGPRIRSVLETGIATWDEALLLFLERAGYAEETYHTFSYSALPDDGGAIAGMLCVVSETTEQVLSERRLRVLRELGDISAITAPTVSDAARAAIEVLGRARLDVPFASVYLLDEPGVAEAPTAVHRAAFYGMVGDAGAAPERLDRGRHGDRAIWSVLDSGRPMVIDGLVGRFPGQFDVVPGAGCGKPPDQVVLAPLFTAGGGRPHGVISTGVSPFRALDGDYRRFLDLVAGQVGAAIADASAYQAQLRRAEELAELDRAKTEFFTGVSHELRTPLTLITGPVEDSLVDLAASLPPAQRERIELVARNAGRLRRLVDSLLEFARLEGGALVPLRVPVNLTELTRGIGESFAPAVAQAGLEFQIDCAELDRAVSVDPEMWEKIALNLLANAVKYTLSGSVVLRLRPAEDGGIELSVADTGIGIAAEDQARLFERFHRVRGAAGRSHEGAGIGLALVAELTRLHGGTATVRSEPGRGSVFTVRLPADAVCPGPPPESGAGRASSVAGLYRDEVMQWGNREVSPLAADVADVGPTAGATVLIAEDNADLRRFLTSLLGPHYPLLQARDGLEALELVRAHRPDLVLTDVMMPGLDGFELLAELRADPATSSIPVIVLSARAGQEAVAEGLAAGADDYLVKPFTSGDLLARVRSNLAMARLRGHEGAWRAALLNAMSDGLLIVEGETGAVVEINEAFTAMLGYGREGLPYRLPHPWWPDPDAEGDWHAEVTRALGAWREGAKGGRWLLPLRHRDGHPVWVEISTAPVPSRDGTGQMVVALVRDRTAEHRADERNRLLADSGRLLTQPGELSDRLAGFAGLVGEAFGALAVVLEAEPDGRMRVQAAAHPSRPDLADALRGVGGLRVPAPLRTDYQAGRATLLATVPEELLRETGLDADGVAALRRAGLRSALVAPLVVGGRLLGLLAMLAIGDPDPGGHPFDQADLELAEELGRRLAGVEEADRAADRERRLHDASAALAAASTVAQAAGALAEAFQRALGSAGVAVYAMRPDDPAHLHLEHNLGLGEEFSAGFAVIELAEGFTSSAVVRSGEPLWLGDRDSWAHRFSHLLSIPRVRDAEAVATLPLCLGERCLGALAATFVTEREFPAEERQFVLTLVGQAAQAFERATQTDAQWRIAQTLQRSLLPADVPAPPRLALATHYQPAGRFNQAGGDWYDIIELDDDRVGVVVGDVVGNGASAAAIMGQLRSALSGFLLAGNSPARALRLLSQFAERVDGALASTAVCLVLDTRTGELRWARAGHPPPLVLDPRADQPARYLSGADGPVLGLGAAFAEALPYTEAALTLRPGASVLLYTDGLIERRGEHLDSGLQRLTDATAPAACAAPRELLDAALHGSLDGACAADDVALVVARLLPAPLQGRLPAVPEQLGRLRRAVRAWASAAGVTAAATEDLQLALGEAVANAVEHAYPPGEPGEFTYHVEYEPDVSLRVDVLDNGRWRPEPADNSHRGRGVAMIRALAGGVSLDGTEHGTHVRFTLPAPGREVPAPAPEAAAPGPPPADETRPSDSGGAWLDTRRSADGGWVLRLGGELDLAATEPLRTELLRRVTESTETFVVDTAAVRYLASAGVRLLADLLRAAPDRVRLRVEPGTPAERALRATALHPAVLDSPALDIAGSASQ